MRNKQMPEKDLDFYNDTNQRWAKEQYKQISQKKNIDLSKEIILADLISLKLMKENGL